jgi:hypothetical protein
MAAQQQAHAVALWALFIVQRNSRDFVDDCSEPIV